MDNFDFHHLRKQAVEILITLLLLISSLLARGQDESEEAMEALVEESRRFAIESPEHLGQEAIVFIADQLNREQHDVVLNYLYALQRVGRFYALSHGQAGHEVSIPESLVAQLKEIVLKMELGLALEAAIALGLTTLKDEAEEHFYLDSVLLDPRFREVTLDRLIREISRTQLTEQFRNWLLQCAAAGKEYSTAITCAEAFRGKGSLPQELLPVLLTMLGAPANFGNEVVLSMLDSFGEGLLPYRDQLVSIRSELARQAAMPPQERTVRLYNIERTLEQFDRVISRL